jgi:hypothetical protein
MHVHAARQYPGTCQCCIPCSCPRFSPCYRSLLHVHATGPCFMSMLHVHATLHVNIKSRCFMPMLLLHAACPHWVSMLQVHAKCPCSMTLLHVDAACPCCMSMLYSMSILYVRAACPYQCCMSMQQVMPQCMSMLHAFKWEQKIEAKWKEKLETDWSKERQINSLFPPWCNIRASCHPRGPLFSGRFLIIY